MSLDYANPTQLVNRYENLKPKYTGHIRTEHNLNDK